MISLIEFRKEKLIKLRKVFRNEKDIERHISLIKNDKQVLELSIKQGNETLQKDLVQKKLQYNSLYYCIVRYITL